LLAIHARGSLPQVLDNPKEPSGKVNTKQH